MSDWLDVVEDPRRGLTYSFDVSAEADLCRTRITVASNAFSPSHLHPNQSEKFEIISGRVRFVVNGRDLVGGPGAMFVVPPNTPHAFVNDSGEPAEMVAEHTPAMQHRDALTTFAVLSREGYVTKRFWPRNFKSLVQIAVSAMYFKDDVRFARPRWTVQRIVFKPLAAYGRRRGVEPILR